MRFCHFKPAAAAAAALLGLLLSCARADEPKDQRQIETTSSAPKSDAKLADKDFLDHLKEGSKYFQDIYLAQTSPEELEFGHVRETPDNWEQRFEKIDVNRHRHQGKYKVEGLDEELEEKKTGAGSDKEKIKDKVRWGDKYGAYGEHYFDFNHDGTGGGGDAAAAKAADDADGKKEEKLTAQKTNRSSDALSDDPSRDRRNLLGNADVEFISDAAREKIIAGATGMHGGNYKTEETGRVKRQDPAEFLDAVAQE